MVPKAKPRGFPKGAKYHIIVEINGGFVVLIMHIGRHNKYEQDANYICEGLFCLGGLRSGKGMWEVMVKSMGTWVKKFKSAKQGLVV